MFDVYDDQIPYDDFALQAYLDDTTVEQMSARFGPSRNGRLDVDEGYDGIEWAFVRTGPGPIETFLVYRRYGRFRIAARSPQNVDEFRHWIHSRLSGSR